jgi:hypothetical protein
MLRIARILLHPAGVPGCGEQVSREFYFGTKTAVYLGQPFSFFFEKDVFFVFWHERVLWSVASPPRPEA